MTTTLITGAARGLGLCFVKECLKRGHRVLALCRTKSHELSPLQEEHPDRLKIFLADVTDMAGLSRCAQQVAEEVEGIDLLLNNAGLWLDYERLELGDPHFDTELILRQFDVNAAGSVRVMQAFLPLLRSASGKTVVNISSEAGSIGMSKRRAEYGYCMSKSALNCASKLMHNALCSEGFRVYAVDPGWMQTDMGFSAPGDDVPPQNPADSARDILDLALGAQKDCIFCNRLGEPYEW